MTTAEARRGLYAAAIGAVVARHEEARLTAEQRADIEAAVNAVLAILGELQRAARRAGRRRGR